MGNEIVNKPPKWDAVGTEPSEELQANGFQAGYKPPAAYFNYLFNRYTACIEEMQRILKEMDIEITEDNLPVVPISKGGTGAKTAAQAVTNIGAAPANHGRHVPTTCVTVTDWNDAVETGWYMGNDAANAPYAGAWFFGHVIAHNENYVFQEIYQFTKSTDATAIGKHIRAKMNGTWGAWTEVTTQRTVPANAKLQYIHSLTSDAQAQLDKKMSAKPGFIELAPATDAGYGGYIDFHYNGSTEDYTTRIYENETGHLRIIAPNGILVPSIDPAKKSLRNAYAGTTDMTAGTSSLDTGCIYLVYE